MTKESEKDMINSPDHYVAGGIEVVQVMEAFCPRGVHRSRAIKYLLRAGKKTGTPEDYLQDLKKARWWLDRAISRAEMSGEGEG